MILLLKKYIYCSLNLIYNYRIILLGNISNPYKIQGTIIINATTIGSNTVQQNDINWSKRILGKLALAQINTNIIRLDLIPNIKLDNKPDMKLLEVILNKVIVPILAGELKLRTIELIIDKISLFV